MQLQEIQHIFLIALNRAKLRLHEYQTRFCPKIIVLHKVQHWWCGVKVFQTDIVYMIFNIENIIHYLFLQIRY